MKLHAISGLTWGCPYCAVGIQRALESAIGLSSRSTSALWMLAFLIPAEVRRSFIVPPEVITAGAYGSVRARDWQTTENSSALTRSSLAPSRNIAQRSPRRAAYAPVACGGE